MRISPISFIAGLGKIDRVCVFLQREDASLPKRSCGLLLASPSYCSVPALSPDVSVSSEGQVQSPW